MSKGHINSRNDVSAFHAVVYPPTERVLWFVQTIPEVFQSSGFKVEMACVHLGKKPTKSQEGI